ncbi:MAG: hypothetical protein FKY71_16575 [Spiribacter salinus]|uniref:Uncharacterized protein n=1 Tax=Spiribacter salinus TaxID=1335746 RepID=A0A540VID0_9GAMM|nr:MAG: hypothetical protein FKY71_16575 [Spiribacter salinus]
MKHISSVIDHTGFDNEEGRHGEWLRPGSNIKQARRAVTRRLLDGQTWAWAGLAQPGTDFLRIVVQARGCRQVESRIELGDTQRLHQLRELSEKSGKRIDRR